MAEFDWQEVAALFVGLLIVGGCVAWGLRHSRSTIAAIQGDVAAFDAVLRALATPELRVNPGPVYEHPMVGTIPSHSTLVGALHGFAIHVDLHDPYGDAERYPEYVVRVRVTAPLGQAFDGARGTSAAFDPDFNSFETRVDGRSLVIAETPRRKSTGVELRRSVPALGNHLRRVVEFAGSIIVPGPPVHAQAPPYGFWNALSGKRVFLLEGDRPFAEALRAGLLDCGAQPSVFEDFQSLIDAAEQSLPDLFVVALELPGENGWGVCNRLKKHEQLCSVPLIVAGAGSGEAEFRAHRQLSTRAQDYVAKPVSVDDMLARIALQLRGT